MKSIIISVFVGVFMVVSSLSSFGQEWTAEQKEVWEMVEKNWESFKKGDLKAFINDYHDKCTILFGDNPSTLNKSQIESENRWQIARKVPTFIRLKPIAINIVNDVANVFYVYKWESKNKEYSQGGRRMTTMIKENNKWITIASLSASCDQKAPCPYGW